MAAREIINNRAFRHFFHLHKSYPVKGKILTLGSVILILCHSCRAPQPDRRDNAANQHKAILKKPASSYQDSLTIDYRAAVFFHPDSLQLEKIKALNEKGIFESITHDCYFETNNARLVIQRYWSGLRIVDASKTRWLIFEKSDHTRKEIDLNEINDICGLYLFDKKNNPARVDMTNINTALQTISRNEWPFPGEV
jgi:hypothetical protein